MEELIDFIIARSGIKKISLNYFSTLMGVYFFKKIHSQYDLYSSNKQKFKETYIPSQFQKLFGIYQKYINTNYKAFCSYSDEKLEEGFQLGFNVNPYNLEQIKANIKDLSELNIQGTTITIKTAKKKVNQHGEGTDTSKSSNSSTPSVSSNKNVDSTSEETLPDELITQCETLQKALEESRGGKIKIPFWENRITPDEYQWLKAKIKDNSDYLKGLINNYPYLVGLYVGEWYKRDYNGDDREDEESNNSLKFYPGYAKDWWETMENKIPGIQNDYLVQLDNSLWVRSLYVLGGLPIRWLKSDKLDPFWRYIYNKDIDDDTNIKQYLSNSQAFLKSLESGSLRKFINALKSNSESVFSESDEADPDIKKFLEKLRNPLYLVTKREKFKKEPFIFIYKNESGQNELIYYVKVVFKNFSNAESSNYLSYARLINDLELRDDIKDLPYFSIVVEDEKKQEVIFFNDYHGFFLSRNDSFYVDLSSGSNPSITIVYPDKTDSEDIYDKFKLSNSLLEEGYIQLYKSGSGWVTKKSVGATILIYDTEKWNLQSENDTDVIYMGDKTFEKVVIYDSVEISNVKSPNTNKKFFREWDSLELIPTKSNFIRYYYNNCLNSYYEAPLPVLFLNKNKTYNSFTGQRIKDGEKDPINAEDLTIAPDLTTIDTIRIENIRFSYGEQTASKKFIIIPFDGDEPILSDSIEHTIRCNFKVASDIPPVINDDSKETYRIDIKVGDDMFYQIDVFLPYQDSRLLYKNTPVPDNINIFPELSKSQFTLQTRSSRNSSVTQCPDDGRFKKFNELETIDLNKTYCFEYDFYAINNQKQVKKVFFDNYENGYKIKQNKDYLVYFQSLSEVRTPMELFKPLVKKSINDKTFLFEICIAHDLPLCAFFTADMLKYQNGTPFRREYQKLCELLSKVYDSKGEFFIREHKSYFKKLNGYFEDIFKKDDFWSKFVYPYTGAPQGLTELLQNLGII